MEGGFPIEIITRIRYLIICCYHILISTNNKISYIGLYFIRKSTYCNVYFKDLNPCVDFHWVRLAKNLKKMNHFINLNFLKSAQKWCWTMSLLKPPTLLTRLKFGFLWLTSTGEAIAEDTTRITMKAKRSIIMQL